MADAVHRALAVTLLALCASFSHSALAHAPYCQCEDIGGEQVRCKGGLSDGANAPGVTLDVIGYDERILVHGKLGEDSTFTFKRPAGEFYVLMEIGPGQVAEVDHSQIKAGPLLKSST